MLPYPNGWKMEGPGNMFVHTGRATGNGTTGGQQTKSPFCFNFLWQWTFGISSGIVTGIEKVAIVAAVLYKGLSAI